MFRIKEAAKSQEIECYRCGRKGDVHSAKEYASWGEHEGFMVKIEVCQNFQYAHKDSMTARLCGDCVRHLIITHLLSMPYVSRDNSPDLFPHGWLFQNRFGRKNHE